ncbi:YadA-like family protein, partial [Megamonas funiformis]|uniref:YadA-like family protein n=1 Tax=Megamonas funiformis TaxID=437897 RepID=UPI00265D0D8A
RAYIPINKFRGFTLAFGKDFTTFDSGIKVANDKGEYVFSVDQNGTVISKDDVKATATNGTVYSLKNIGANTAGITRKDEVTTIEGNKLSKSGIESIGDVTSKDGNTTYSLNTIGANTKGIVKDENGTTIEGTTTFDSNGVTVGDFAKDGSSTAISAGQATFNKTDANGNYTYTQVDGGTITASEDVKLEDGTSLSNIGVNTKGIVKDENGTTIEGTTTFDSNGVTVGDFAKDGSSTAISAGQATFNKTDANGNYTYTQVDGGTITASEDIGLTDGTSLKNLSTNVGEINKNTAGISRDEETTTIEGVASFNKDGMTVNTGNSFVNVGTDNIVLNNSGNGVVINDEGTSIFGAQGKHSINITTAGTEFVNGYDGTRTVISGGDITTDSITVAGNTIDNEFFKNMELNNANTEGIQRKPSINNEFTTSIETTFRVHSSEGYNVGTVDVYGSMIESTLNGQKTVINGGSITTNSLTVGGVSFGELVNRVDALEDKTQNITSSNPGTGEGGSVVPPTTDGQTGINGDVTVGGDLSVGGNLKADSANIGGVTMKDNTVTATTGNFDNIAVGGEGGTTIDKDGITVGTVGEGESHTSITKDDVKVTDSQGNTTSLTDVGNRVTGLESSMNSMNNRINDVEDRIDKVGAMAAAIANLRTMGFDPEAPTEIAIGVGQYKSETGLALGVFHYPNQDFMLSASISTSGDEVMGGIGATWKLGRKSVAEKAKDEEAKRLEKAEDMKKLAQEEKVKAQAERHAKLLAEREAQETA